MQVIIFVIIWPEVIFKYGHYDNLHCSIFEVLLLFECFVKLCFLLVESTWSFKETYLPKYKVIMFRIR